MKWYYKNKDKVNAYRLANRERYNRLAREWYAALSPEKRKAIAEKRSAYHAKNRDERNANARERFKTAKWKRPTKEEQRAAHLKREYGLSVEAHNSLLEKQGFVCAVCFLKPSHRALDVDHCHTTGQVRGLLCSACNIAIGLLRDDPSLLLRAAEYLQTTTVSQT